MSEEQRNAGFAGRGSTADPGTPVAQGLYDPALDKDSCGVGFIADIKGRKSHQIIEDGLRIDVAIDLPPVGIARHEQLADRVVAGLGQ
ncbi:MAG TPA: hypothetical protein VFI94_15605, partial [Pseudolabrys sp.]|nr:hypothetical protein [Pseudolabrys sp.]